MNVSVAPPSHQLFVEISPLTSRISTLNNDKDLHTCGSCKRSFSDLNLFVEHKGTGCSTTAQKTLSAAVASFNQTSLGYVTANDSSTSEDNILSLGTQYVPVILDEEHLDVQGNQSQNLQLSSPIQCQTSTEQQILRARLLGATDQGVSISHSSDFSNNDNLHTLILEGQQHPCAKQREFQNDEEDVATLLANQMASEVVNSGNESLLESRSGKWANRSRDNAKSITSTDEMKSNNINNPKITSFQVLSSPKITNYPVIPSESSVTSDGSTSKKKYKCTQESCDFTAWYLKDLIRHERTHTGERPFQCNSCNRSFSRIDKLHMHERIHTGDKRYQCKLCSYATYESGSLRKHMRIHNDERPYKCQMCPYRSRDTSQLTVHLRTHTGDSPFVCTYENCTAAFKTSSDLTRHSRTHTGEKPFSCSYCQYKCAIKSNLRVHIQLTHSEVKNITCIMCNYIAHSKQDFKEHEKTHIGEIFKCGLCSYTCDNVATLKVHCKVHEHDKIFSCKICSFTCRLAVSLKTHMRRKHAEPLRKKHKAGGKECSNDLSKSQSSIRSGSTKGPLISKIYCAKAHKCTYCDAAFVREDSWRSHMRQHKRVPPTTDSSVPSTCPAAGPGAPTSDNNVPIASSNLTLRVETSSENKTKNLDAQNNILSTDYLILSDNSDSSKENPELFMPAKKESSAISNVSESGIETSIPPFPNGEKGEKEQVSFVHQLCQEVLDGDSLQNQPILLYLQNAPVLHNGLDSNLCNAEIVASINQPSPILVTRRCGPFLSLQLDQSGSLVQQFSSPLPQGMQYIVSTPFENVVGSSTTYIQSLDANDSSGNVMSVVSVQEDKEPALSSLESN